MKDSKKSIKGVNLGGWLVVERWMTPSLFKDTNAVDEHSLSLEKGAEYILNHRRNFITEQDFKWLRDNDIEAIRVPVGYWILESQDGYVGSPDILDWCFEMASKYKIKVLINLHGGPGSQNNEDHSGDSSGTEPEWFKIKNLTKTTDVLVRLAKRYANHPYLIGVSILNEPNASNRINYLKLRLWSSSTAWRLRRILPKSAAVVFSDAYNFDFWYRAIKKETLDIHHYQCHSTDDKKLTKASLHLAKLQDIWQSYRRKLGSRRYIVGEWSSVLPKSVGASRSETQQYITRQLENFSQADATFYWSYKTERKFGWNYRWMVEKGFKF